MEKDINNILSQGSILEAGKQRHYLLKYGLGLRTDQEAEYTIISGCAVPFGIIEPFIAFTKLLDLFDVDYTFLKKEYCCGGFIISRTRGNERKNAEDYSRKFVENNVKQAKKLGSSTVVTLCAVCAYLYSEMFGKAEDIRIIHYPELLLEKIKGKTELNQDIAYYEGCYKVHEEIAPRGTINLGSVHQIFEKIKGLKVTEIASDLCCITDSKAVINQAIGKDLNTVVCSCSGCHAMLKRNLEKSKKMEVKFLTQIILESLR
ncbi:MAG: heterodisulfide reductase-related iron-sulfur binding cluster [Candidatus Lokiarchaeia archaeon]